MAGYLLAFLLFWLVCRLWLAPTPSDQLLHHICPCNAAASSAATEEKEARQAKLADAAWQAVCAEYDLMRAAIRDPAARGTDFTQPWLDFPPVKLE
jgi:hypothetical protein